MILERDEAELHLALQKPNHKAAPFNVAHTMVDDKRNLSGQRPAHHRDHSEEGLWPQSVCVRRPRGQSHGCRTADLSSHRVGIKTVRSDLVASGIGTLAPSDFDAKSALPRKLGSPAPYRPDTLYAMRQVFNVWRSRPPSGGSRVYATRRLHRRPNTNQTSE
jgi:hypothetical protein